MAWPGILTLGLCVTLLGVVILRTAVRKDYRRLGRLTLVSSGLETFVFAFLGLFIWLSSPSGWPAPASGLALAIPAWAFIAFGVVILAGAMGQLGLPRSWGHGEDTLLESGVYRLSRNPQIAGCAILLLGAALISGTWYSVGWMGSYSVIAHTMVLTEEEHLTHKYGDAYRRYCSRVPRYVGIRPGL